MARGKVTAVDWFMLFLALLSVGLLIYETVADLSPEQTRQILLADYVIIGIFAIEYLIRLSQAEKKGAFVLRTWYELIGMIPVSSPAVRGFRLFRIIRIVVILSRFGRAADRAFGEEFTYRFIGRFKRAFVDALGGAITLRVLDETEAVLVRGQYAKNMADAIERNGDAMLHIAIEKVKQDPAVGRVRHLPFFEDVVETTSRVSQRILIDLFQDPRMDVMIRDIIRDNTRQIRAALQEKERASNAVRDAAPT